MKPGGQPTRRRVLFAGTLALLCGPPAVATLPPATEDAWVRVESRRFSLLTNGDADVVRRLALDLEALRTALASTDAFSPASGEPPLEVFVFRDDRTFRDYRRLHGPEPADVAGFFVAHADGHFIAVDGSPRPDPRRALFHEFLHHVLASRVADLPLWLNEGLAEVYSSFESHADLVRVGLPLRDHLEWLRTHAWMPLEQLLALDTGSPDYHEGRRRGAFYAESWALTHFLLFGPEPEGIRRFLDRGAGPRTLAALASAFQTSPAALETALQAAVRAERFDAVDLPAPAPEAVTLTRIVPLPAAVRLTRLGDLLAHTAPHLAAAAAEHYRAALELDPRHGPAVAGLGFVAALDGDEGAALARFREAARLAPDLASIQRRLGKTLLAKALGSGPQRLDPAGETAALLLEARRAYDRARELDPDDPEVWAGLALTHSLERRPPAEATLLLERAVAALPTRADLAFDLAQLYARSGRRADAERLAAVLDGADPSLAASAREAILQAELLELDDLLAGDRLDDALALVVRVEAATSDPALRRQLAERRTELRFALAEKAFVERYNEAVDLANGGRLEDARRLLASLADDAPTPARRAQAEALRERLAERR